MRSRAPLLAGFTLALAILLGALGWIAHTAFELERGQGEARALATREEHARLALWRMDSALSAFLAQENARPVGGALPGGDPRRPYDRLRFEIDAAGNLATAAGAPSPEARALLGRDALLAALAQAPLASPKEEPGRTKETAGKKNIKEKKESAGKKNIKEKKESEPLAEEAGRQMALNSAEFGERVLAHQTANQVTSLPAPRRVNAPQVRTPLQPIWVGSELLLARRIERDGSEALEGIWLNREALEAGLLGRVRDLLPAATLLPARNAADPGRQLALLPMQLDPGPPPALPAAGWTAARWGLVAASLAILLVAVGTGALLAVALRLARRRDDFVSAVTHELRTPLTTFRMYTEMLDEGMVPKEKTAEYLRTLRAEAERLGQLVENVFAFARLERRGSGARREIVSLSDLLDPIARHLAADLKRRDVDFFFRLPEDLERVSVQVDPMAVERILQNLADNAAKFARGSTGPPRFEIQAEEKGQTIVLIAADNGPGIPRRERRRLLFRLLRRSAAQAAAEGAPGLGLGLALSRGLARSFGGELHYVELPESGAAFALDLPLASTHQGSKQS